MVASGHDMRDVELVEGDDARSAARPGSATGSADPAPRTHRRPRTGPRQTAHRATRRWAAGLVLALVGVGGGEVASAARARSTMAALAGVPGVLAPLDGEVVELWRADRTLHAELAEVAGLLVGVMGQAGRADVVALDPATGATVWRTPVRPAGPGDGGGGVRCVVPDPAPPTGGTEVPAEVPAVVPAVAGAAPVVACVVDRSAPDRGGAPAPPVVTTDRLLVLDAATGAVVAERPVPRSTSLDTLGSDLVVAHVDRHGVVHVARTDPLGGEVRWSFVAPRPLPVPRAGWGTRLDVVDGMIVVDEMDGWVLSADGAVLHGWRGSVAAEPEGTARVVAGRLLTRPVSNGGPYPRTEVVDLVTGRSFAVRGRPLGAWPDDGSLDGSMLVRSGGRDGLAALDARTGELQWGAEGRVEGRSLVVDGRIVRVTSRHLTSVDGRTGRTVWQTPLVRPARTSMVTDGRLVVVTELDGDRGLVLGAYGLDDGRLRWRSDVGDDVAVLAVFGRRLFGWTGEQLVALGAPGQVQR